MRLFLSWKHIISLCCVLVYLSSSLAHATVVPKQHRLLIINSYNEGAPWSQTLITPIMLQTSSIEDVNADLVHINGTFIRNDSLYNQMEEGIFQRYERNKPDYLVLIGSIAFTLRDRIQKEWGDIPMVLIANEDTYAPREYYFTGRSKNMEDNTVAPLNDIREQYNFTFIEAPDMYKETIDMMVRMLPPMKKLVFAADELYQNQRLDQLIHSYITSEYPNIEYERLVGKEENSRRLQEYLLADDPTTSILFSTWFYERKNLFGSPTLISSDFQLVASSPQPVFALRGAYINKAGFIGGHFYDQAELEQSLTNIIGQMLQGKEMRDIPFVYSKKSYPLVNYAQLELDELDAELCPSNTIFLNKPLTFWQKYKWWIISGTILLLSLVVIALIIYWFQQKKIALFSAHNTLVCNMPISYTQAIVDLNEKGEVTNIKYQAGNSLFNSLFTANEDNDTNKNSLSQIECLPRFIKMIFREKQAITFTHFFKQTHSFYEFIICRSSEKYTIDIFGVDITARNEAENALREINKKLEMTLSVARIIPWRWDLKNDMITCESEQILAHMNFTKEEGSTPQAHIIKASEYFRKMHPEDLERMQQVHKKLISGKLQHAKEEFRIITEVEGRKFIDWLETNAIVDQYDEQGSPISLVGSLLLITERKRQEKALIAAREKALESERLKSAFLANMSHEIRTPLNAIVGFSSLLTSTEDEQEREEFISIIENNNQLLLQLVSDILDLSKIEANTLEFNYRDVDLNGLAKDVESTVRRRLKPNVVLEFIPGAAQCHVQTEKNRLSQVLINLLVNATKFTQAGSITFGYEIRGKELYFYVKDTGMGISQEDQNKIFERFTKVDTFTQGTGLGLSICKNIIEKMKGRIGVESEGKGKGSTFWFTVPYQPGAVVEQKKQQPVSLAPKAARQKPIILVAEDNESNYLLFNSILNKDYNLVHAWNGEEAIELYRKFQPHVIIMDINMPKMDGYEAAREIRKFSKTIPIIAVTAYSFSSDKEKVMENGFNGYVPKPVDAHILKEKLHSTIKQNIAAE